MRECLCGDKTGCQECSSCSQCCDCLASNPDKGYLSTQEIFDRLSTIAKVVESRNYHISQAAKAKIGEEFVRLGYELIETPN